MLISFLRIDPSFSGPRFSFGAVVSFSSTTWGVCCGVVVFSFLFFSFYHFSTFPDTETREHGTMTWISCTQFIGPAPNKNHFWKTPIICLREEREEGGPDRKRGRRTKVRMRKRGGRRGTRCQRNGRERKFTRRVRLKTRSKKLKWMKKEGCCCGMVRFMMVLMVLPQMTPRSIFFWFGVLFIFPNNWVHSLEFVPAFNQRIVSSSNIEFDTILGSFSVLLIYSEPQKLSAI